MLSQFKEFWIKHIYGVSYNRPIPETQPMSGWKDIPIAEDGKAYHEPLVPLGLFTEDHPDTYCPEIFSDGIYFGERDTSPYKVAELEGALITSFVREGVAKRLAKASKLLPEGHAFLLLDTLRTEQVQASLFEHFKNKLMASPFNFTKEAAIEKTQDYVSQPSRANSPHMTGGAVDLTIVKFEAEAWKEMKALTKELKLIASDKSRWQEVYHIEMRRHQLLREKSQMLNMGVAFDEVATDESGDPKTALRYYEEKLARSGKLSESEMEPLRNRRLLYNVMRSVGFTFFPEEPWHADFGNKFWAKQSGSKAALYGYAAPTDDNMAHEKMRRGHHEGSIKLSSEQNSPADASKTASPVMSFVHAAARMFGVLRHPGRHEIAHRINPDGLLPS